MSKKFFIQTVIAILLLIGFSSVTLAMAQRGEKKPAPAGPAPQKKTRQEKAAEELRQERLAEAQGTISVQEWVIYLTPKEPTKKPTIETDILMFSEGKLTTKNLSTQGYISSNYRLDIDDAGTITWETMQVNEEIESLVFLRGELKEGVMTGAVIRQPKEGKKQTYYYSTLMPQVP